MLGSEPNNADQLVISRQVIPMKIISVDCIQCSSLDTCVSEPKCTRNLRQPNTRTRVYIYVHIIICKYSVCTYAPLVCISCSFLNRSLLFSMVSHVQLAAE